ncbi:hypothetical protein R5H30_01120 [Sulfitobacter sp. D35]|uniref:hypothetical protein n=1 Tax=Sulfitobacter sp. D35 TaxID=3083252 RepID=UPI00296FB7A3|nr:hypothetical protein [Sulfitobacter sp. D35]MDW4496565.1 hypothetical protein [Sulfitobacter sp. D35]
MQEPKTSAKRMSQTQAAWLLLAPFLITYGFFLVYPFFRGFWISLHDWNLLAVAFNPDAKEFVGFRNYERVMWGRNIEWGFASPFWQGLGVLGLAASAYLRRVDRLSRFNAIALAVASVLLVVLPGFHPGEMAALDDRFRDHAVNSRQRNLQFHFQSKAAVTSPTVDPRSSGLPAIVDLCRKIKK